MPRTEAVVLIFAYTTPYRVNNYQSQSQFSRHRHSGQDVLRSAEAKVKHNVIGCIPLLELLGDIHFLLFTV
jgi:hypothetical protein